MKISFLFVAALSVASVGCKKKGAGGAGGSNDCAKAAANTMALSKAQMEKAPSMDANMIQKMIDLGVQHCKDDKWSADAVKCMTDATTFSGAQTCFGKLTKDQQDKMNVAAMDLAMSSHGGGGAGSAAGSDGAATGSGSAATGSGSAAAGSGELGSGSAAAPK